MISFIICSINPQKLATLLKSIAATVKTDYEIISFDNTLTKYAIAKVYNMSVEKALYENLIFVHEDMEFFNRGWEHNILKTLAQPSVGVVGLAGSRVITRIPSYWHAYEGATVNEKSSKPIEEVITIDGFFIALKRDIFSSINFDESLSLYHAYDIDICLAALQHGYQNYVSTGVSFVHHSNGTYDANWVKGTFKVFKKYSTLLPLQCDSSINMAEQQKTAFVFFSQRIIYVKNISIMTKALHLYNLFKIANSNYIYLPLLIKTIWHIVLKTFFKRSYT